MVGEEVEEGVAVITCLIVIVVIVSPVTLKLSMDKTYEKDVFIVDKNLTNDGCYIITTDDTYYVSQPTAYLLPNVGENNTLMIYYSWLSDRTFVTAINGVEV